MISRLLVVAFLAIGFGSGRILIGADRTCNCPLSKSWSPQSYTFDFHYSGFSPTNQQKNDFESRTEQGADRWNLEYLHRHENVSVSRDTGSPNVNRPGNAGGRIV